jgi:hydroxylamine reductase
MAGVCGKTPETSSLQDLLLHAVRGLSLYAAEGRRVGVVEKEADEATCRFLSSTLASANFDPARFVDAIGQCVSLRARLKEAVAAAGGDVRFADASAHLMPATDLAGLVKQGVAAGMITHRDTDEDIGALRQLLLHAIKGVAAHADRSRVLGQRDEQVHAFVHEGLAALTDARLGLDDWVGLALKCGEVNLRAMEMLDAGNTGSYGHPAPTAVALGHVKGTCILVSGHDLKSLADLLLQTKGAGITVYTHGEMLPAHGYPELKKHPHLYGHFGTAWPNQKKDFSRFPGAILLNGNCLQEPEQGYLRNMFTTGAAGWPGVTHLENGGFGPVAARALSLPGFASDEDRGSVTVGFARNSMMSLLREATEAVKSGAIKRLFLVAGCDGTKPRRNYYTDLVAAAPRDSLVLTLGCGKFRFLDHEPGRIGGIPRLLDIGQCNDAYSAIQMILAMAKALDCSVNDLPLSLVLSWYGQGMVAILLTLLHLGVKGIRLGPSLPAFLTPKVMDILIERFDLKATTTADQDLAAMLE